MSESTERSFFQLLKSGLWRNDNLNHDLNERVDWGEVYRLAEEQSVVGLLAAGIDAVRSSGFKVNGPPLVPQAVALQFIGQTLQIEQRNKTMNAFIADLIDKMRKAEIYTLLVKGQGVAQCYEKPLWRTCGDVDFFLSDENYEKAKEFLIHRASSVESEGVYGKHLGMIIDGWTVELHGRLRCGFSSRADRVLDEIQNETFYGGSVSSWNNGGVQVFKLSRENEVFYVFAHFLGHFYKGGIGLRQICDWCRLLWTYRESIDVKKLEKMIRQGGLMAEWMAFGVMAVEWLGMPLGAMPLLDSNGDFVFYRKKAKRIVDFVMSVGNFGHNRDMSFYREGSYLGQKARSFGLRIGDLWNHLRIFPMDTLRFFPRIVWNGVVSAMRGE